MNEKSKRAAGRPIGRSNIRDTILHAARKQFSHHGYEHTTMRSVADEVGINPALIVHYFSSKQRLFLEAMLPMFQAPATLNDLLEHSSPETIGSSLAKLVSTLMGDAGSRAVFLGLIRATTSDTEASVMLHEFVSNNFQVQLRRYLPGDNPSLTATIVSSLVVGLFVSRYITKIEPLASMELPDLERQLAYYFQACIESQGRIAMKPITPQDQ